MSRQFNKYKNSRNLLVCLIVFGWSKNLLAQQSPVSVYAQSVYEHTNEDITNPTHNTYQYYTSTNPYVGHTWNSSDFSPETDNYARVIKADYGTLTNSTINRVDFKFIITTLNNPVSADLYLYNNDMSNSNPETEYNNLYSSGGVFIKTVSTSSSDTFAITISNSYFSKMGNSSVFSLVLRPNYGGESHVNQLLKISSETILRYATGPCDYDLGVQKFLIHDGNGIPTLNTVPLMCLGVSNWWIDANRTLYGGCNSLKTDIPLRSNKIFMTVWECNDDLTHKNPANYIEWEQTINRGSANTVDWFDLKANLPPGGGDFFKPDGVYDLWLWNKDNSVSEGTAGNRFFHVWTDNGNISDVTYSVDLRQYNITISNSIIKNNYSQGGLVDILAGNEILILPGSQKSELLPDTWYHINSSQVGCNNILSVGISGPKKGDNSGTYTWAAVTSLPASEIVSYSWSYSYDGVNYSPASTSSSITQQLPYYMDIYFQVTVTSKDGQTATGNVYVMNLSKGRLSNIASYDSQMNGAISPNPNNGSFTFSIANDELKDVYVYNAMGQEVFSKKGTKDRTFNIDITNLSKGIYIVKVASNDDYKTTKVIVE